MSGMIKVTIKDMRLERGISQNQLARLMEMSVSHVRKLETNKTSSIPFETLNKLCSVLDCEVGDLIKYVKEYVRVSK
jgi:putative transcriptional regulator